MLDTLLHQELALAMKTFGIFFSYRIDGTRRKLQTFGLPRQNAIGVRTSFSASRRSVLARLALRLTIRATDHQARGIEHMVHDTSCLERCSQNPSYPAP
jgi:hypothetical protein